MLDQKIDHIIGVGQKNDGELQLINKPKVLTYFKFGLGLCFGYFPSLGETVVATIPAQDAQPRINPTTCNPVVTILKIQIVS